ncbi:hypothetical protein M1N21_01700 [Dehalococcoidia bacterium]|nr:hypothetical protein [Dehalococcoidia bacterium]
MAWWVFLLWLLVGWMVSGSKRRLAAGIYMLGALLAVVGLPLVVWLEPRITLFDITLGELLWGFLQFCVFLVLALRLLRTPLKPTKDIDEEDVNTNLKPTEDIDKCKNETRLIGD